MTRKSIQKVHQKSALALLKVENDGHSMGKQIRLLSMMEDCGQMRGIGRTDTEYQFLGLLIALVHTRLFLFLQVFPYLRSRLHT